VVHFPELLGFVDFPLEDALVVDARGEEEVFVVVDFDLVDEADVADVALGLAESALVDVFLELGDEYLRFCSFRS
jgi:hypothetical protein